MSGMWQIEALLAQQKEAGAGMNHSTDKSVDMKNQAFNSEVRNVKEAHTVRPFV